MNNADLIRWAAGVLPQWKIGRGWVAPIYPKREDWSVANTIFLPSSDKCDTSPFGLTILASHLLQRYVAATPEPEMECGYIEGQHQPDRNWQAWSDNERAIRTAIAEGPIAVIKAIKKTGVLS